MRAYSLWCCSLLLLAAVLLKGQSTSDSLWQVYQGEATDTSRVRLLGELAKSLAIASPDSALSLARRSLALANATAYPPVQVDAHFQLGRLHYGQNRLDSAIYYYRASLSQAEALGYRRRIADNYYHLANAISNQDDYETAEAYYLKAFPIYTALGDERTLMRFHINHAWLLTTLGRYPEAAELLYTSIRLAEKHDVPRSIFNARHELGYVKMQMGDVAGAQPIFETNALLAEELGEDYKRSVAYGDLGYLYAELGEFERALEYDLKDLAIQEASGNSLDLALLYNNVGNNYYHLGDYLRAISYFEKAINQQGQHRDRYNRILATIQLGLSYHKLGQSDFGARRLEDALAESREIGNVGLIQNALTSLREVYIESGKYRQAYMVLEDAHTLRDSLAGVDKSRQLAEVEAKYETEKQAKEIALLEGEALAARARRTQLWGALLVLAILAGAIISLLRQRHQQERQRLAQEKAVADEQRRVAELENEKLNLELTLKQQELTAKVLQLCQKNEFLQKLEAQLKEMSRDREASNRASTHTLSQRIQRELEANADWEEFFQMFTEVHPRFVQKLQADYPNLTKSELRLASLLRMNLSSKEISQLLNISPEGVKKSRYRLRKKLALDGGEDLDRVILRR